MNTVAQINRIADRLLPNHQNQMWWGGGSYQLLSSLTGSSKQNKCIDLYAGNTTAGNRLEIWDCVSGVGVGVGVGESDEARAGGGGGKRQKGPGGGVARARRLGGGGKVGVRV